MAIWTNPATPVALTPITVAFWNINGRDNLNWCRAMLGGADPTAAYQVPLSIGPGGTSWSQVVTNAIADQNVTAAKIADQNVTTAKIADQNVTAAKIADQNVLSNKIGNGQVIDAHFSTNTINGNKLLNNSVTNSQLAGGVALANIGYTPVNRAGDSGISGPLGVSQSPGFGQAFTGLTVQNNSGGQCAALVKFVAGGLASWIGAINGSSSFTVLDPSGSTSLFGLNASGQLEVGGQTVWHRGNDGAGSGLDADLLDGRNTGTGNGNIAFYDANGRVFAAGFADAAGSASSASTAGTATNFSGALAGDVTGTQGATVVANKIPIGAIVMFRTAAEVPTTGWLGEANLTGRFPIGVDNTGAQRFNENTSYGTTWTPTAGIGATNNVSATSTGTGVASTSDHTASAGTGVPGASHTHGAPTITIGGTVDIVGAGGIYIPPCRAYVFARKT